MIWTIWRRQKSLDLVGFGTPDCSARSQVNVPAPLVTNFYSENTGFQYTLKPDLQTRSVFSRPCLLFWRRQIRAYLLATRIFYVEFSQVFEKTASERQLFSIDT
jgi:hypothetical protein